MPVLVNGRQHGTAAQCICSRVQRASYASMHLACDRTCPVALAVQQTTQRQNTPASIASLAHFQMNVHWILRAT